jgi:hypothetical protein
MTEFKFKEKVEGDDVTYTEDPHYDLFDGGYIKPEDWLVDPEEIADVYDAIALINSFLRQAEEKGHLQVV